jgi:hypothetical protein
MKKSHKINEEEVMGCGASEQFCSVCGAAQMEYCDDGREIQKASSRKANR